MKFCRKCGAPLRDNDKYCSSCGARVPDGKSEKRKQRAEEKKREKEIVFRTRPEKSRGYLENFEEGESRVRALRGTVTVLVFMLAAVAAAAAILYYSRSDVNSGRNTGVSSAVTESPGSLSVSESISQGGGDNPGNNASSGGNNIIQILSDAPAEETAAQASSETHTQVPENEQPETAETAEQVQKAEEASADEQTASSEESETTDLSQTASSEGPETTDLSQTGTSEHQEAAVQPGGAGQTEMSAQAGTQPETEREGGTQPQTETETQPQTEVQTPSAADAVDAGEIQQIIASESTASSAEVYVYDLKHDSEVSVNDCTQPMHLSALVTVPILYTAASRIDSGELSMDTPVTYVTTIGGRGENAAEPRDGQELPLSFYLQTMVGYSDNNCVNILIDFLGLDSINSVCQEAGYTSVSIQRGLVSGSNTGGLDNYASAKDLSMMVRDLYTGKFVSVGTDFMNQYFHISQSDSLPTLIGLAPGLSDDAVVLNQNGFISTRYNETAVINDGGASYILTVMLYGEADLVYSQAVADVSEYVNSVMK